MNKILWLASWYPTRLDASNGDFIERHARAVSLFTQLTVMVVVKDAALHRNEVQVEKTVSGNLTVYRGYYGCSKFGGVVEKIQSSFKYFQLQKKIYRQIVAEAGAPGIVHVHVAMKAGMLALWLKKKFNIPFVVTEHWTGYYPQSKPSIYNSNLLFRNCNKKVLEEAALFLPVSDDLGKVVNTNFANIAYQVIPNTVDTSLFYYQPAAIKRFRFIHPSYMNYQKNPGGILLACKMVKERGYYFDLLMVGNKDERLEALSISYGLASNVIFRDAIPYAAVAKEMQGSSALFLFSRFENLPCVVLEALCCGLPVISSRVGGIAEVVNEHNGILVESENAEQLANAMIKMMTDYNAYNRQSISKDAIAKYNYEEVGREIVEVYQQFIVQNK